MYFSVTWSGFSCLIAAECCCCCCCCCCWLSAFSTLSAIEGGFFTVGASNSKFMSLKYFLQFSSVGSSFCLSSLPAIASRTAADGEEPLPNPELPNSAVAAVPPERSTNPPLPLDASSALADDPPAPPVPAPTGVKIPGNVGVGCAGLTSTSSRDDSSLVPAAVVPAEAVPAPGTLTRLKLGDLRSTSNVESNRNGVVVVAELGVALAPPTPATALDV
uniref:Putative secreted peptide n=1 Tax=Anopheles braziliensis TaxID=58242 RepID=A0A2M3ZNS0_9DIPT